MKAEEVEALQAADRKAAERVKATAAAPSTEGLDLKAVLAWAAVGIPLAWGVWITLEKALVLFR
jgi:hypothetical protein